MYPTRPSMSKSDWVCVVVGVSALACGSVSYVQRPLTRAQAEMLSEAAAGKPVSVELIPMPSSSRSPIVSPDVQSDAASSTSFNVEPTKPIVLQHVRFDADSIEGASASGPRTLPIAAVRAVTWPGRRLWARGLGVGALLGGVLIHQHVRAAVEQAVHEELAEVLGVELYERSEARRGERNDEGADVDWADRRAGYKSRPHEKHLAQISSSNTPVVVMEATEYGDCVDAPLCRERPWNRLLVTEGLVRTRFVVKADVLGDDAAEVISLRMRTWSSSSRRSVPAKRSAKAFMSGARIAVRATRTPDDLNTPAKRAPSFVSRSQMTTCGASSMVLFLACCARHSSVGAYVTAAWRIVRRRRSRKKSTNTSRNRMSNVCTKSHAHVTWFRRNVDQLWPSPPDRERRMYR